jgi:hypothetical protein
VAKAGSAAALRLAQSRRPGRTKVQCPLATFCPRSPGMESNRRKVMCDNNVGVAKRIDLENISKDVAKLVKELDDEVPVQVRDIKKIQEKLEKIIKK